jgi:glycosyltransferase involved in cell wall biosynthesis
MIYCSIIYCSHIKKYKNTCNITLQYARMSNNRELPKICLNMIVKNESKIIQRLLDSVLPMIDCYCICDTGSTDNTVNIIETFFRNNKVPGKIVREPFRDFGYNRSFALQECDKMEDIDYVLLMDADMVLQNDSDKINEIKRQLWHHSAHHVLQGSEKFYNKNVRFVKHHSGMSYWGVTHEYVKVPDGTTYGISKKTNCLFWMWVTVGANQTNSNEMCVS